MYWENGGLARHILVLRVSGQLHAPAALTLSKESPVPTGEETG